MLLYCQFEDFIVLKSFVFIVIYSSFFLKVGHVINNKQDLEQEWIAPSQKIWRRKSLHFYVIWLCYYTKSLEYWTDILPAKFFYDCDNDEAFVDFKIIFPQNT